MLGPFCVAPTSQTFLSEISKTDLGAGEGISPNWLMFLQPEVRWLDLTNMEDKCCLQSTNKQICIFFIILWIWAASFLSFIGLDLRACCIKESELPHESKVWIREFYSDLQSDGDSDHTEWEKKKKKTRWREAHSRKDWDKKGNHQDGRRVRKQNALTWTSWLRI